MRDIRENIRAYLELCKPKISLFAVLSSVSGFFAASAEFKTEVLCLIPGVFMLACGSSALNQYQERHIDAFMERTRDRPVPSKKIRPLHALFFSMVLISSGLFVLSITGSLSALLLGLLATLWYNGFYTYLKRKTAFAVVPGALVGAIPPAIGWVLGGGGLKDPRLLALCFFFFMWQVPHFWILLLNYGKEYEKAGLPSLSGIFSRTQLLRIITQWVFATIVSCLFISLYGLVRSSLMTFFLFAASLWFFWQAIKLMGMNEVGERAGSALFRRINYYMLSIIVLASFDHMTYVWTEYGLNAFIIK